MTKGEPIVKFHSLRRSLVAGVFAFIAAAFVASCGGGGAATNTEGGANFSILPATGSIYAGVPTTFTIVGGRAPYTVASSEPALLPVPTTVDGNSFTVVAANPGVVDPNTDPNIVPSRTVTLQVRESGFGLLTLGSYKVIQNFLTGYGVNFTPIACAGIPPPAGTATSGLSVPAGCEIGVQFNATTNGNRFGARQFRLDVIRGPFFWIDAVTGLTGNSIIVTSDHTGRVSAVMRTTSGVPTQIAVLRITELTTEVFTDTVFTISGSASTATLTVIPSSLTFTGPDNVTCGTGEADVFVFDGTPPYNAGSSNPNVVVIPIAASSNPGVFRLRAVNSNVCLTNATVVFTDRFGARATATVTTAVGATAPPAPPTPPVTVTPNTMTLGCGQSGSAVVTGGKPPYSASSSTPGVTAVVAGSTLTINRAAVGSTGASTATTTATVNVTDGTTIAAVTVTVPTTCP